MPKNERNLTNLEMRNLIFDALAEENKDNTPFNKTFKMNNYEGCISDLRKIVEYLAIKNNMIDKVSNIDFSMWFMPSGIVSYKDGSNFNEEETNIFIEEVHLLMFQNVISPGAIRFFKYELPYFHVTEYGKKCLHEKDVLPYDYNGYLKRIDAIPSVDEWERFYIEQSLKCYNFGVLDAAIMMLGLAGEYLAIRLIEAMKQFLESNEPDLYSKFENALKNKNKISQRYQEYENCLKLVLKTKDQNGSAKYSELTNLSKYIDAPAKTVYNTFLRLTRNELLHPQGIHMDRIECLTMFISFIKYCETQHKYLDFYNFNS